VSPQDGASVRCHAQRTEGEDLVGKGGRGKSTEAHILREKSAYWVNTIYDKPTGL